MQPGLWMLLGGWLWGGHCSSQWADASIHCEPQEQVAPTGASLVHKWWPGGPLGAPLGPPLAACAAPSVGGGGRGWGRAPPVHVLLRAVLPAAPYPPLAVAAWGACWGRPCPPAAPPLPPCCPTGPPVGQQWAAGAPVGSSGHPCCSLLLTGAALVPTGAPLLPTCAPPLPPCCSPGLPLHSS